MKQFVYASLMAAAFCCLVGQSAAATLTIEPAMEEFSIAPGDSVVVRGDVSNITGAPLFDFELFGVFSGYPADTVVVSQVLGAAGTLFPDRTRVADVPLFVVELVEGAEADLDFSLTFFFLSVGGVFSEAQAVSFSVDGAVGDPIPLPASWLAFVSGVFLVSRLRPAKRSAGVGR